MTDRETIEAVCALNGFDEEAVLGRSRFWDVAVERAALCVALSRMGWSASKIGRALRKDHTTILYLLKRYAAVDVKIPDSTVVAVVKDIVYAEAAWDEIAKESAMKELRKHDPALFKSLGIEVMDRGRKRRFCCVSHKTPSGHRWEISCEVTDVA